MAQKSKPKTEKQGHPNTQLKTEVAAQPNIGQLWNSVKISVISSLAASAILAFAGWVFFYSTDYIGLLVERKIDTKLQAAIEKSDGKLQTITDKLSALGERVAKIEGKLDGLRIQRLAMQPKIGANGKQASEILKAAKKDGTKLDPELITDVGKEFISAGVSSSDTHVWNAALAFLDYRSFLNSSFAPATDKFAPVDKTNPTWSFALNFRHLTRDYETHMRTGSAVPAEKAAVLEHIGRPLNVGKKVGSEFLLIADLSGGFILDGYRLKNVIFKDSKIIYEGGPVEMENVYFVNCTFEVSKRPNGKNFANTVLASTPATTFQAGG